MLCRICGAETGGPFLSLGQSPLSNSYLSESDLGRMEPFYPLDVYVCHHCHFAQLPEFELAAEIFNADYAYYSSYSSSWLEHCRRYADMAVSRFSLGPHSRVVEIASNDGYLLQYFQPHGLEILGIEPAEGTARMAMEKGIPTEVAFFNTACAKKMSGMGRQADLLIGNNVLAHNPDLHDFTEAMNLALKPGGTITLEFPHLLHLMRENQFDTIYHEHFSYFTFYAVKKLLEAHRLSVFDVEEIPTHGGSLRVYAGHAGEPERGGQERASALLSKEEEAGLYGEKAYGEFVGRVERIKRDLLKSLIAIREAGGRIAGYGAPAKGNTLLNYCGIRTDLIDYTVDRNPHKQGRYLPGTHIPVFSPERIADDRPGYVLVLPWNLKEEIMEQMGWIREWGGRFIIPIPSLEVI